MTARHLPYFALSLCLACGAPAEEDTQASDETSAEGDGDGDPSGDGDGDGDPSGDGDGDASGDGDGDASGDGDGDASGDGDGDPSGPLCAGHAELCDRPYDQVAFATTHNSHAALDDGFSAFNANHQSGMAAQLDAGIRGFLIDTYYDQAAPDPQPILLCHGPCGLGSVPHLDTLELVVEFLQQNPTEFVSFIYQDGVSGEDLALEYEAAGAIDLVYTHELGSPWPTLGEMIEADTRLVVTVENGGPPPAWHHNIWEHGWDTPYGPSSAEELSCALNRGSADNQLFLVNHWVNNGLGLPSAADADIVNQYEPLLARAQECQAMWDHIPNFLAVDFWERGDVVAVVNTLNEVD